MAAPRWTVPTLDDGETHRQAYQLLGPAWRSSAPSVISTGTGFDVVQAPQDYAAAALDRMRTLGTPVGAVYAEGDNWRFFVPPGSGTLPWSAPALCLSGPALLAPARAARGPGPDLRWITRGEPCGQLLWTPPTVLWAALAALAPPAPAPVTHTPATRPADLS
ncbi:hypothetical protein AB0958_19485 [Streptomyces sp. NPDC006655]|uniref:hypothetical protein n=1 Tax=Streptomyces sp. NPDC006655 TaxID=3156898 RepID=UPI003452B1E6